MDVDSTQSSHWRLAPHRGGDLGSRHVAESTLAFVKYTFFLEFKLCRAAVKSMGIGFLDIPMVPWSLLFCSNDARLSTPQTFLPLHCKRSAKVDATCQLEHGGKTIRNFAVAFYSLFISFYVFFSSFFFSFKPISMRRFCFLSFLWFDVLWHLSRGQRRSTLDGNKRRSSRPEISGDGNWQITRFSASQAAAPCTAYGCLLQAV